MPGPPTPWRTRGRGLVCTGTEGAQRLGTLGLDLAAAAFALARRFAAGATLWCWSPEWPHHAQHIAVEFVHPVIVGKRALPAEAVEGADVTAVLRSLAVPGDVLAAVAPASDGHVASLLRRASAWGVTTMWVGAGRRPATGAADHVLWLDAPEAAWSGDLVLAYHVLWELTHVCFEHPGLLREEACTDEVCITCSDQARLGEVISLEDAGLATVRTASGAESVETTLVGPVQAGDLLLLHAGTAIGRVDG